MKFLNKMERKFGKYALHNLSMYIISFYVIGYMITMFAPRTMVLLALEPELILQGQVWRLFSWVLVPPESLDLFTLIMLFLYFSLGTSLERSWGAFRYNVYIFTGIVTTIMGAFILYALGVREMGGEFSTYYINMSIFLAFAVSNPNQQLMLYFLIPIKMKWMGIAYALMLGSQLLNSSWVTRVVIIASLFNFILFFLLTRNYQRISPHEIRRKQKFKRAVATAVPKGITKHKCAVCGRTELDGEHLEFRFCSKCEGNYEYCQEHLFTHEHIHKH